LYSNNSLHGTTSPTISYDHETVDDVNDNILSQQEYPEITTEQQRNKYTNIKVGTARLPVSSLHTQFDLQLPFVSFIPPNYEAVNQRSSLYGLERELACHQSQSYTTRSVSFYHGDSSTINIDISMFLRWTLFVMFITL